MQILMAKFKMLFSILCNENRLLLLLICLSFCVFYRFRILRLLRSPQSELPEQASFGTISGHFIRFQFQWLLLRKR